MAEKKMYRVKEFAEKYGVSSKAIYDHIKDGTLPAHRIAGVFFIDEAEVLEQTVYTSKQRGNE